MFALAVVRHKLRLASNKHHLFDTLYHATSLSTPGATLVTADGAYFDKAAPEGGVARLADYALPTD